MNFSFFGRSAAATAPDLDRKRLRRLIDQATNDSSDESEEHTGLLGMIREEVQVPFKVKVEGELVECQRFEVPRNGFGLNAVCKASGKTRVVDISRLEWVDPLPQGHEWIDAYFAWRDLNG